MSLQTARRICVIGPSNSGKSTLAAKISQIRALPLFHLDQIAHIPGSQWQRRPDGEFEDMHRDTIQQSEWIIEGNYSSLLPERLKFTDYLIWLDLPLLGCNLRYLKRCLGGRHNRIGGLSNCREFPNLELITYSWRFYPKRRHYYQTLLKDMNTPYIRLTTMKDVKRLNARILDETISL